MLSLASAERGPNRDGTMAEKKKIWEKKNPKSKSKSSTPAEKASAKKRAKEQGRSKPSLVDNINAQKTSSSKGGGKKKKKKKKSGAKS